MAVNVLVVDDSGFMRNALSSMLSSDPDIKVIGTAQDGIEAVQKVSQLNPDVVTMDVEMPRMDGLEALRIIMERHPVPVIMVSALTTEDAKATLEALELGAVDFIPKNLDELSANIVRIKQVLVEKVKLVGKKGLARKDVRIDQTVTPTFVSGSVPLKHSADRRVAIVVIGTSTGGPKALQEVIPKLPKEFPVPIVIAQHMPPNFTQPFADRLNQLSSVSVKEAAEGEPVCPGVVYIAPGRGHMQLLRKRGSSQNITIAISESGEFIYRPSVDHLCLSVAELYAGRSLGIILTGMGNDGLKGLTAMKRGGSKIYAQNEDSCVVFGMPKAVIDAGIADKILGIDQIAGEIVNAV